jgi:hypothetical protein
MRPGQIGRSEFRWLALLGAMLALSACQATGSQDSVSPESKRANAQPAAPILSGDSASFIGLGDQDLSRTLGQPKQVRKDAPAEVWQYSGADCVVDFYLYSGETGLAVAYMEARNRTAESTPADRCVKSLLQSVSSENSQQKTL